jgi:hypothetical protein
MMWVVKHNLLHVNPVLLTVVARKEQKYLHVMLAFLEMAHSVHNAQQTLNHVLL